MTDPQSTTDVDATSVPVPSEGEEPTEDTLSHQVAKTDAALHAWRGESVKRRASWEAARAKAEAEMLQQRRKVLRFGAVTLVAAILTVVGIGSAIHQFRTSADARAAEARILAPRPPLARVAVPEGVPLPPEAEVAVAEAPAAVPATPVAEPAATAPAPVASASAAAVGGARIVEPGSARIWNEGGHVWAAFATRVQGPVRFRYLDAGGQPVLEPMGCQSADADGIRRCSAGRSRVRLSRAVEQGAAAGTWTVQACGSAGCADVGTFAVR
jgi:hypothetical protein